MFTCLLQYYTDMTGYYQKFRNNREIVRAGASSPLRREARAATAATRRWFTKAPFRTSGAVSAGSGGRRRGGGGRAVGGTVNDVAPVTSPS